MHNKISVPGYEFNAKDHTEQLKIILEVSCKDIIRQRQRLGGDWAVSIISKYQILKLIMLLNVYSYFQIAFTVFSQAQRDIIRSIIGNDVIFIILQLTPETNHKRLVNRHGDVTESLKKIIDSMSKMFEPAGKDEKNAFDVLITEDMTPDDVAKKVLDILEIKV